MWGEKRYHSLDYALKSQFGEKVYRISLNGGMTCPNRDGKISSFQNVEKLQLDSVNI